MSDEQDRIDELYAEGATDSPPPELDEKIRASARQPLRHPWYRNPGRLAALATAASLVIAVSVIFFEPEQLAVEDAAPALDSKATRVLEREEITFELDAAVENQPLEAPAAAPEPLRRMAMPASEQAAGRQAADSAGVGMRAQELTQEQREQLKQEPDLQELAIEETVVTGSRLGSAAFASYPADELARRCGPLPGTEETREVAEDESGWRVTVSVGADVRTWRCIDGAWIETTSEQQ